MATPKKRAVGKALADSDAFTVAGLKKVMREKVLNSRLKMPGDDALAELARILEFWRKHFLVEQDHLKPRRELQNQGRQALEQLETFLTKYQAMTNLNIDEAPVGHLRNILKARADEIQQAIKFVDRLAYASFFSETAIGQQNGWQWLADVLPKDFENAMKSTNPDYEARIGNSSPLTRFIAAIVPILTRARETPTANSVAVLLKTRQRKLEGGDTRLATQSAVSRLFRV